MHEEGGGTHAFLKWPVIPPRWEHGWRERGTCAWAGCGARGRAHGASGCGGRTGSCSKRCKGAQAAQRTDQSVGQQLLQGSARAHAHCISSPTSPLIPRPLGPQLPQLCKTTQPLSTSGYMDVLQNLGPASYALPSSCLLCLTPPELSYRTS